MASITLDTMLAIHVAMPSKIQSKTPLTPKGKRLPAGKRLWIE
jgi:hypothetical protein